MDICGEDVPVFDMDQERLSDFISNWEPGAEPVRVGTGGASVGTEAGQHHRVVLAQVKSAADLSAN